MMHKQPVNHDQMAMTICIITMDNGFTFIGKSAPADPNNFDADVGKTYAYEDAVRQIWPMMGFELKSKLMGVSSDGE